MHRVFLPISLRPLPPPPGQQAAQGGGGGGFGGGGNNGPFVLPGTYKATLNVNGRDAQTIDVPVKGDPDIQITDADRRIWFDTARELTERWHHQQQIRLATGRPGLMVPEFYHPVLDCFLRGLPFAYRTVPAALGTSVLVEVEGDCGGAWQIARSEDGWRWVAPSSTWDTRVAIPQEIAWRVFTKGIARADAEAQVRVEGDRELGLPVLGLTAIVA